MGNGAGNCPVVVRAGVLKAPVEIRLNPSELATVRSSSAKRTRSRICGSAPGPATSRLLTTLLASGATSAEARSATDCVLTRPVSDSASRAACTSICSPGNVSRSSFRTGSRFCDTVTA